MSSLPSVVQQAMQQMQSQQGLNQQMLNQQQAMQNQVNSAQQQGFYKTPSWLSEKAFAKLAERLNREIKKQGYNSVFNNSEFSVKRALSELDIDMTKNSLEYTMSNSNTEKAKLVAAPKHTKEINELFEECVTELERVMIGWERYG